ncbi:NYN domain-containing protein [Chloroflexota bacterium]
MTTERQVAVLIDFENVNISDIEVLLNEIPDVGRIIIKRAYADWSTTKPPEKLSELGIEPVLVTRSPKSGKNSCDIRLTIDATDLLHQSPVDTFVIASSDSDFVPLVSKLRSHGKAVYGAGRQAIAAKQLVRSCDRYIFLDTQEKPKDKKYTNQEVDSLLITAVKAAMDTEGKVPGSKLLQTMQRLDPSFDFRQLGYSTFLKFIEASSLVNFTKPKKGDITVELKES